VSLLRGKNNSRTNRNIVFFVVSFFITLNLFGYTGPHILNLILYLAFSAWLTIPIFSYKEENVDLTKLIIGYLLWVAIQYSIVLFGIAPPEGSGIPHF